MMKLPPPQNGASEALRPSWSTVNHFHQHISKTAGFWRTEDFHGLSSVATTYSSYMFLRQFLLSTLNTFLFRVIIAFLWFSDYWVSLPRNRILLLTLLLFLKIPCQHRRAMTLLLVAMKYPTPQNICLFSNLSDAEVFFVVNQSLKVRKWESEKANFHLTSIWNPIHIISFIDSDWQIDISQNR